MSIEITKPAEGRVVVVMSYEDAQVVSAILGSVNHGSFFKHAPALSKTLENGGFWAEFPLRNNPLRPVMRGTQIYLENTSENL